MEKEKRSVLLWLSRVIGKKKIIVFLLMLVQMLLGISSVFYALILRNVINAAVDGDRQGFGRAILTFVVLFLAQLVLRSLKRYLNEYCLASVENNLKHHLFAQLMQRDYSAVSAVHSAEWINRLTSDSVVVAQGITQILPGAAGMGVNLLGALAMLIKLEPRFFYILIPGGILLIVFSYLFRVKFKKIHKRMQEKDGNVRKLFQELIECLTVVKTFAIEDYAIEDADGRMAEHKDERMRKNRFSVLCNTGFEFVMDGVYVLGAIFCGYGILSGTMSYGNFTATLQLIAQVQSPFAGMSGYVTWYYSMVASAERLMDADLLPESTSENLLPIQEICEIYDRDFECIGISDGCFKYDRSRNRHDDDPTENIIEHVSVEFGKGEYVAFLGESGCGKSTFLKLLLCLYPLDSGERYIVTGGERKPLTNDMQRLFAYVPQGNFLMSGTIREIISFADKSRMFNEGEMQKSLKIACADEFVNELPNGLDTALGERGSGLSEGQMQRLAIARAVFSGCPILLLDEATSALDEGTERKLLNNLRSMTNRTVLIVTHRPAAIRICDKCVRFDGGTLTQERTESSAADI